MSHELDARGLKCPLPVLKARKKMKELALGEELTIFVTDPGAPEDFAHFCETAGYQLRDVSAHENGHRIIVKKA